MHGSRHQIRLPTITLHVMHITTEPQTGSFEEPSMKNGNQQLPRRFSGSMGNVCHFPTRRLSPPDSIFIM